MSFAAILGIARGAASYWREILIGLLALGLLWYRGEYHDCQASVAIEAAKAEEKVRVQKEADAKFTRELGEQLKPVRDAIQEQSNATSVALAKVKSDPNCLRTPAASAFDAGVLPKSGQQANPRAPGAARP